MTVKQQLGEKYFRKECRKLFICIGRQLRHHRNRQSEEHGLPVGQEARGRDPGAVRHPGGKALLGHVLVGEQSRGHRRGLEMGPHPWWSCSCFRLQSNIYSLVKGIFSVNSFTLENLEDPPQVVLDGRYGLPEVTAGLRGLRLLKTTKSAFVDFVKDAYRSLPDMEDRYQNRKWLNQNMTLWFQDIFYCRRGRMDLWKPPRPRFLQSLQGGWKSFVWSICRTESIRIVLSFGSKDSVRCSGNVTKQVKREASGLMQLDFSGSIFD